MVPSVQSFHSRIGFPHQFRVLDSVEMQKPWSSAKLI